MCKAEVFVKEYPSGNIISLVKIGRACQGIDKLKEGETELLHVKASGSNALQKVVNNAYILATTKDLPNVVESLKDWVISCNKYKG